MHTIHTKAAQEQQPIKEVVNEILELGLNQAAGIAGTWEFPSYDMGGGKFDYTKAWDIVDGMEAEAVAEKLELRK